jgi:hypothetical protein
MFEAVKPYILLILLLATEFAFTQDSLTIPVSQQDIPDVKPNPTRILLAAGGSVVGYAIGLAELSQAWYKNYPQTSFHFFNDNNTWLQVDKAGHVFGAYTAGRISMEVWRWAGLPRKQRVWIGGLSGTAFMTIIEVLDGYSAGWGFSVGDMAANLSGSGLFIAQELAWNEQRIHLKFSFHKNTYADPILSQRANALFGNRGWEQVLKDYNGQTYWVSTNLRSFFKKSGIPAWFNIAIGYGAEGMFGGSENRAKDANGIVYFNRTDIPRRRQWYLSPDIDLTRIRTKSKLVKTAFFLLNAIKIPAPSIGFSKDGIEWNWLHF